MSLSVLMASTWPAVAIDEPVCALPRCMEETIALDKYTFRFNVLLPPGYADAGNSRSYPVLYLYMGGNSGDVSGHNRYAWLRKTPLKEFTASLPVDQQAIVVLPDPGLFIDSLDGSMKWETFGTKVLIPYVDQHYRTIADGRHRAIAGLSWGGYGSMHHASRHPDLYAAAAAFSGAADLLYPPWAAIIQTASVAFTGCAAYAGGNDPIVTCGGYQPEPGESIGPFGLLADDYIWWRGKNPVDLASNLGGMSLYLSAGNGVPCDQEDVDSIVNGLSPSLVTEEEFLYVTVEGGAAQMMRNFEAALTEAGVPHHTNFRDCGFHSWRYFFGDLVDFWPRMIRAFGRRASSTFDFRFVEPQASVWGWTFGADPGRATEFLDVADASRRGVGLRGSGVTTVTTAGYFDDGQLVRLTGATEPVVVADQAGRITFTVDLGAPHAFQQDTVAAIALETAPNYWTSRVIEFWPEADD